MNELELEPGENLCDNFDWITDEMMTPKIKVKTNTSFWERPEEESEFNFERNKTALLDNLNMLSNMSVEEATLYKKWQEWNKDLHSSMSKLPVLQSYFDTIWTPTDIMDKDLTINEINSLQPYIEIVEDMPKWTNIRRLISSMEFTANPGRNVKAYVKDRVSGKLLGVISLGSDVVSVKVRDEFIGWSKDNKFVDGKLNNIAMGTTIVATQPLGYNFLGGKLMSALTTSPTFRSEWFRKYNDVLCAIHTTALYGASSQYNGIPHFKTLGESAGKIGIKPDDNVYRPWMLWIKETYPDFYAYSIDATGPKQVMLNRILKEIGLRADTFHHGFKRGVYLSMFHENGREYLQNKIEVKDLVLRPKFAEGDDYTIKWWKDKAIKRYTTLHTEGRLKNETLYYIDVIGMTWEDCKKKYLKEVGR
jgi:hypothetical protein